MTHLHSKLIFALSVLLCVTTIPTRAMKPEEPAPYDREKASEAARARWEEVQERARLSVERFDRAKETQEKLTRHVNEIVQDGKVDAVIKTHEQIMQEAEESVQIGQAYLAQIKAAKELKNRKAPVTVLPIETLNHALDADPELSAALNAFFQPNPAPDEQIIAQSFGPETAVPAAAATKLPATPEPERIPVVIEEVQIPVQSQPVPAFVAAPARQPIDESFVASVLNNIMGSAKAPVVTAGTLGLVHYLYENQVFNQAVAVRSPKMKAFLHDYALPMAREALAAHFIQLVLPHLPYLRDKNIRSFGTTNYLACFLTTKMLGSTTIYFAKMLTESEQGKKIVTHYKRLPKKAKETIAKVLPWLGFAQNMFIARSLASYFDPVCVNPGVQLG